MNTVAVEDIHGSPKAAFILYSNLVNALLKTVVQIPRHLYDGGLQKSVLFLYEWVVFEACLSRFILIVQGSLLHSKSRRPDRAQSLFADGGEAFLFLIG